jgi:hypothetical protein
VTVQGRRATLEIESNDLDPEEVSQLSGAWALLIAGLVSVHSSLARCYFTAVVCSRSWIAAEGWNNPPAVFSETWGPNYLFPWGLLVVPDTVAWSEIVDAFGELVEECDRAAGDDGERFIRLMTRFVVWDDDEFRERNMGDAGSRG